MSPWWRITASLASLLKVVGESWRSMLPGQLLSLLYAVSTCLFRGRRATFRSLRDVFVQQVDRKSVV